VLPLLASTIGSLGRSPWCVILQPVVLKPSPGALLHSSAGSCRAGIGSCLSAVRSQWLIETAGS
jgi:hypothetical protein